MDDVAIRNAINQSSLLKLLVILSSLIRLFHGLYFALIEPRGFWPVAINAGCCLLCAGTYFFINIKQYKRVFVVIALETAFYAVAMDVLLGPGAEFHMFVLTVLIPVFYIFNLKPPRRALLSAILILGMLAGAAAPLLLAQEDPQAPIRQINTGVVLITFVLVYLLDRNIASLAQGDLRREYERVRDLAYEDPLTKLKTRQYAKIYFDALLARQTQDRVTCFALVDIDFFKTINDTYGHEAGDRVLEQVGATLKTNFRSTDLLCRWGGEEFLIVMDNCPLEIAVKLLERVRAKTEETPYVYNGTPIQTTITAGVTTLTGCDLAGTIRCSDEKLYAGKTAGRNRVVS
jgi:diguanylate cyclase (GGDEF)-like protein